MEGHGTEIFKLLTNNFNLFFISSSIVFTVYRSESSGMLYLLKGFLYIYYVGCTFDASLIQLGRLEAKPKLRTS